jgi:hypothetical protein
VKRIVVDSFNKVYKAGDIGKNKNKNVIVLPTHVKNLIRVRQNIKKSKTRNHLKLEDEFVLLCEAKIKIKNEIKQIRKVQWNDEIKEFNNMENNKMLKIVSKISGSKNKTAQKNKDI